MVVGLTVYDGTSLFSQSGSQKAENTHTLFRQFFVYAVKDPLIWEVETQLMSVGGVY